MHPNIELDDALIQQAMKLSQLTTKEEVVNEALKNYVGAMKKRELLKLIGHITWEGNLKEMRRI